MRVALEIAVAVVILLPGALVLALFVWGARQDGQADRALQERLGIRRKTRLGP